MRQFDCAHVLPLYTAFVKHSDVYVISPLMCYNSCRDIMNTYFTTGKSTRITCMERLVSYLNKMSFCRNRFPRDNRLPYITRCSDRTGIYSSKGIHTSFDSGESHSNQSK